MISFASLGITQVVYIDLMNIKHPKETSSFVALLLFCMLLANARCWCFDSQIAQFNPASGIDFSPDNLTFLTIDSLNSLINFWRIDTKALVYAYNTPSQPTTAKFSKDGQYIGIGMTNGDIIIFNVTTRTNSSINNPLGGAVMEIDFSWNSNSLLACSSSKLMFMDYSGSVSWTISGGSISNIYSCKLNKADGAGFSFNTNQIAWYQYNTNTLLASEKNAAGGNQYFQVDFSMETTATGMRLMAANKDSNVYWVSNGMSGTGVGTKLIRGTGDQMTVCQSKDNKFVASGDKNGKFYIANTTSRVDSTFSIYNQGSSSLGKCRFSYDNKYLAVTSATNGLIYIYTTDCFPNKCRQGFYDNSGICTSCSTSIGCLTCTSATTCTACIQGFYLSGSSCASCVSAGCQSCESSSKCLECSQGYYLDYSSYTCNLCSILPGCIACERNSSVATVSCRQCSAEYFLNNSDTACIPCSANNSKCMRCFSSSVCLQCQMGYYLDSLFQCQTCTGNCLVCTNISQCLVCSKGYYSSSTSNTCVTCGTNCLDCYNTGSCNNCAKGTYLNAGVCNVCVTPCVTCNSLAYCYSCTLGYYYSGGGSCLACPNHCLTCNSSSYCLHCQLDSYLTSINACTPCYLSYPNCVACNSYVCLSCLASYYLSLSGCQSCSAISGCNTCLSSTHCTLCFIGYYSSAGNCLACPSQCEDCSDSVICSSCSLGYYLSAASCLACVSPCVTCTSATDCFSCQNSYYLDTAASPNTCIKCSLAIIGCLSCDSSSDCNQCELGRYVTAAGGCDLCPINCSVCNSTTCLSCSIGFYPTFGYCSKCYQNCSECTSLANCSSCNVGFYLDIAYNFCIQCASVGCETCNANECLSCQTGYFLSASKICVSCNNSFSSCQACSQITCTHCLNGFYLHIGTCSLCYNAIIGCADCYNSSSCIYCEPGYYLQINFTCAFCPSECKTCNAAAFCTSCQLRYTFNAAQTDCLLCESYIDGCLYCTSITACQDCFEGFYLFSPATCSLCNTALTGCVSCANSSHCIICQDEYYLLNGTCVTCELIPSCNYCLNSTTCLSCRSGYFLNSYSTCSLCTVSLPACIFCASSSTCSQCQVGYFLNAVSQCQQCLNSIVGCLSCLNSTKCIECDGGYYLNTVTFQCMGCNMVGCQICGDSSPSTCTSCNYGYYLSGNICNQCPQAGCIDCFSATLCLECAAGYFLSSSNCIRCDITITGCSKCLNSTVCSECDSTFYLNSSLQCSSCLNTLPSCAFCFNSSYCTTCSAGYYSQSGSCKSCSSITGCFMCQGSSVCNNCLRGYYLSSGTCAPCSSALLNCFQCMNSSICMNCVSGFLLDINNTCQPISIGTSAAPQAILLLQVRTFYISSQALKHILYVKQGHRFTRQSIVWNNVAIISLYNSAKMTSTPLTITNVQWSADLTSIIFLTSNPLNLNTNAFSMPLTRLLVSSEDFSLSYQTKFSLSQAALSLLIPDIIFSNDFTQETPLMKPSFYISYVQNSGEYYFTILGYVIVTVLFGNFLLKSSCTYPNSKDLGEVVPHVLALKSCALAVYPIYPQVANFCYGLMGADLPWFASYFGESLSVSSDTSPAGFQLFYFNMNFASLYLAAFGAFLLLLLLGYLCALKKRENIEQTPSKTHNSIHPRYSCIRMIYLFFSFGITFAGSAAIQGSLYNPVDYYSINGIFYMMGGVVYCVQLAVVIFTRRQGRGGYLRSFLKASLLSVAHISPIYICSLAVVVDLLLILFEFNKCRWNFDFPKVWLMKGLLTNASLLCLFYYNQKKIALLTVVLALFVIITAELMEHLHSRNQGPRSNRVLNTQQSMQNLADINDVNACSNQNNEIVKIQQNDLARTQTAKFQKHPQRRKRPFKKIKGHNSILITEQILSDNIDIQIDNP